MLCLSLPRSLSTLSQRVHWYHAPWISLSFYRPPEIIIQLSTRRSTLLRLDHGISTRRSTLLHLDPDILVSAFGTLRPSYQLLPSYQQLLSNISMASIDEEDGTDSLTMPNNEQTQLLTRKQKAALKKAATVVSL